MWIKARALCMLARQFIIDGHPWSHYGICIMIFCLDFIFQTGFYYVVVAVHVDQTGMELTEAPLPLPHQG